ncbi:MAG TPA: transcriptional regulator [Lactobacillus sp.]|nr:transcriptional regulator [Lactobacillus sp.]
MKKNITISEIAAITGVSTATVSRFLNGHFERMSAATKTKVQDAITQNNYHVNRQAQSLKIKATHLVGMVVADVTNIFSSILFKGSDEVFEAFGYQILLMNSDNSKDRERQQLKKLLDLQVDGIILQPISEDTADYTFIKDAGIPTIVVDRAMQPQIWPLVTTDNHAYSKLLTQLLLRMEYQQIVVISETLTGNSVRTARFQGVKDAVTDSSVVVSFVATSAGMTNEALYAKLIAATDNFKLKTAIYALKGTVLIQVRTMLTKFHVHVPNDVGLVAFDDWNIAELMEPQITTIQQNPNEMGAQSAKQLLASLNSDNQTSASVTLVDSDLKMRQSLK